MVYKMHMGWKPSLYYEKTKHNFWQFVKSCPDGRWVKEALLEMQQWPESRPSWWLEVKTILNTRNVPHTVIWSKLEFKHYWNTALRRETDSMDSNLHASLRRYNRILHSWWIKWLLGELRLFGEVWRDRTTCPLCNAHFSWDHMVLQCPELHWQTEERLSLRELELNEQELTELSQLIYKRWSILVEKFGNV